MTCRKQPTRLYVERLEDRMNPSPVAPALNSRPGSANVVYLNFVGDPDPDPASQASTPPYSIDKDPAFSAAEVQAVRHIWRYVADYYSLFDVNITTVRPVAWTAHTGQVDIGGRGDWFNFGMTGYLGITFNVGAFDADPSVMKAVSYVFSDNTWGGPDTTAIIICHELGHLVALGHQSVWQGGEMIAAYSLGANGFSPVMGASYYHPARWWNGLDDRGRRQDDVAMLGAVLGLVADEPDQVLVKTSSGVINSAADVDAFTFAVAKNQRITFTIDNHAALSTRARIVRDDGTPVTGWVNGGKVALDGDSTTRLVATLAPGSYRLLVGSTGDVAGAAPGDFSHNVGPYSVEMTGAAAPPVAAIVDLAAARTAPRTVRLTWTSIDGQVLLQRAEVVGGKVGSYATLKAIIGGAGVVGDYTTTPGRRYAYRLKFGASLSNVARV